MSQRVVSKDALKPAIRERPDSIKPKDNEELRLEKLVFGDNEGFHNALQKYRSDDDLADASSDDAEENSALGTGEDLDVIADDDLFFIDTGASTTQSLALVTAAAEQDSENESDAPAWIDSEDEKLVISLASDTRLRKLRTVEADDLVNGKEYIKRLQQQFERLYPRPAWAIQAEARHRKKRRRLSTAGSSTDEDDSDSSLDLDEIQSQPLSKLLQSTNSLTEAAPSLQSGKRSLRAGVLDIQRGKDIGPVQPSAISSLSFHPTKPILLSSGPSGLLTLHHLSSTSHPPNPTIHTLSVPRHPIYTAEIHPSGNTIYFSSRRRYFLTWSLTTGKITQSTRSLGPASKTAISSSQTSDQRSCERFRLSPCGRWIALIGTSKKVGVVNILDAHTAQWICQARIDGRNGIADIAWWHNGTGLTIASKGGDIIEYSIPARRALARWRDEGIVAPTTITLGGLSTTENGLGGDTWLAIGLQSGYVTIYNRSAWTTPEAVPAHPAPVKTFSNLTTSISHLHFSADAQMLMFASRWKKDALRLVHVASWTVYARWPASGTPLGRITAAAFSPDGRTIVVGNEAGKIRAWEIRG